MAAQLVALGIFYNLFKTVIPETVYMPFIAAIAGTNIVRFLFLVFARLADQRDSTGSSSKTVIALFVGNFLNGTSWGAGLVWLSFTSDTISLNQPIFAFLIAGLLMVSLIGTLLHAKSFTAFAITCLVPLLSWTSLQYPVQDLVLWFFLAVATALMIWISARLENIFSFYRGLSKQNTTLLQDLAGAKEQAITDRQTIEKAHDSLKTEVKERKAAEEKIRASEMEMTRILRDMQDTFFRVNAQGNITRISPSVRFLLGKSADACLNSNVSDIFANHSDYQLLLQTLQSKAGIVQNFETKLSHTLGHDVWASINAHYSGNSMDQSNGFEGTIRDITANKQAGEALFQEKERLHVTLESIGDGVITTDVHRKVEFLNPVAEWMTGWNAKQAQGQLITSVFKLVDENTNKPVALPLKQWLKNGRRTELADPVVLLNNKKERSYTIELTGAPIFDSNGEVIGTVLVFRNVTKLRTLAKQLSHQATHDALTSLINRTEFESRVKQAINSAQQDEKTHALCYIDLDQFKIVNDTCGHHAGDELLKQLTAQLKDSLRESDTLARLGGDEFGVLLVGCPLDRAKQVAEKIRADVEKFRFIWDERVFRVGASIGLVSITPDTPGLTELLSAADSACYVAKESGRNLVHVYKPDDRAIADRQGQMQWTHRIQHALEENRFELHFQSIIPVGKNPSGFCGEILVRLIEESSNGEPKLIMPNAFIPAAERYQLMPKIDQWVVTNALEILKDHYSTVTQWHMCSINLSGQSIGDPKLLQLILETFKRTQVSPEIICFEITESSVIANLDHAHHFINTLKDMGCRFALDDFGTGLSSFAYLKNLPVDYLKLDGELVKDIAKDNTNYAMVDAINRVAHVMGMKTIAEHVESEDILTALQQMKVDYAQGFGIEPPVTFKWAAAPNAKAS